VDRWSALLHPAAFPLSCISYTSTTPVQYGTLLTGTSCWPDLLSMSASRTGFRRVWTRSLNGYGHRIQKAWNFARQTSPAERNIGEASRRRIGFVPIDKRCSLLARQN
jgi:hypothetical protein